VLAALAIGAAVVLGPLSTSFPSDTLSAAAMSGWERMAGEGRSGGALIQYEMYVAPDRPALYAITRFRVTQKDEAQPRNEFLIWNSRPGQLVPLRCFERIRDGRVPEGWEWRVVPQGTDDYRTAMFTAMRVYALHQEGLVAAAAAAERRR
jgi:hypothetical protein